MSDAQPPPGTAPAARSPAGPRPSQHVAVVLLVAASGAVETVSFVALGHVFAGVMTSNFALLGIAIGRGRETGVTAALLALAGFALGTAATALATRRCSGTEPRWPRSVRLCLGGEAVLLAAGAAVWAALGGSPGGSARDALQFGAAVAMGVQSAAMVAAGRTAAPTTYLTGTLAAYIVRGVGTARPDLWVPARFAALIAGSAVCMAVLRTAPEWAGVLPVALLGCGLAVGSRR
ncbi:DUF1275 domain-containing protein [Yinghuangia sp. ASG 101]|uniref:DUF1275 family protein n=1 Tax=Yinghuangia sp. ASG 101 TaxID=2896848 RepID=UPI001E427506|nr:DUF1275 family protein [Yinghuangia sp. ASG 101]UGQ11877.1 DUF1275 domain-containing protein [Yinghuangia sp. ASG 101]